MSPAPVLPTPPGPPDTIVAGWRYSQIIYTPTDGTYVPPAPPADPFNYGNPTNGLLTGPGIGNGVAGLGVYPKVITRTVNSMPDRSSFATSNHVRYYQGTSPSDPDQYTSMLIGSPNVSARGNYVTLSNAIVGSNGAGNTYCPFGFNNFWASQTIVVRPGSGDSVTIGTSPGTSFSASKWQWINGQPVLVSGSGSAVPVIIQGSLWWALSGFPAGDPLHPVCVYSDASNTSGTLDLYTGPYTTQSAIATADIDALWTGQAGISYASVSGGVTTPPAPGRVANYDGSLSAYRLYSATLDDQHVYFPLGKGGNDIGTNSTFEVLVKAVGPQTIGFGVASDTNIANLNSGFGALFKFEVPFIADPAHAGQYIPGPNNTWHVASNGTVSMFPKGNGWYIMHVALTDNTARSSNWSVILYSPNTTGSNDILFGGIQWGSFTFANPDPATGGLRMWDGSIPNPAYNGPYLVGAAAAPIVITIAYPLDATQTKAMARPGNYRNALPSGYVNSWYTPADHVLSLNVRWIEADDTVLLGPTATRWNGDNGWDKFLQYARSRSPFTFVPDVTFPAIAQTCYLMDPIDSVATLESDLTRMVALKIRSDTEFTGF